MFKKANKEIARFVDSCSRLMPADSLGEVSCFRGMMGTNYNYASQARASSSLQTWLKDRVFPNDLLSQRQINRTEKDLFKRAGKQAPMDTS